MITFTGSFGLLVCHFVTPCVEVRKQILLCLPAEGQELCQNEGSRLWIRILNGKRECFETFLIVKVKEFDEIFCHVHCYKFL